MSFIKEEFKMKSILVSSVKGYSGKSAVIIATMEKMVVILGEARVICDAKIREIKELVGRVLDLGRLLVK